MPDLLAFRNNQRRKPTCICHFLALRALPGKKNEFRRIDQDCTGGGEVREGWFDDAEKSDYASRETPPLILSVKIYILVEQKLGERKATNASKKKGGEKRYRL